MMILNPLGLAIHVDEGIELNLKILKQLKCKTWPNESAYNRYAKNHNLPIHSRDSLDNSSFNRIRIIGHQLYFSSVLTLPLILIETYCLASYLASFNHEYTYITDHAEIQEIAKKNLAILEQDAFGY